MIFMTKISDQTRARVCMCVCIFLVDVTATL